MKKTNRWEIFYLVLVSALMYIPIVLMVIYSFNESKLVTIWSGFSVKWYEELFSDRDLKEALVNSLILASVSCLSSGVIGTIGAYGMMKLPGKMNDTVEYLAILPMMIPEIILGMVFLAFFSAVGLKFGMMTLVIAHTAFGIPYVLLVVKARLAGMDPALEEAARDLGSSSIRTFFDITLPLAAPGILSGMLLAFAMSFDDVVISIFVTGAKVSTLPIKIYTKMKTGITPEIYALSALILIVTVVIMVLSNLLKRLGSSTIGGLKR